MFRIISYIVLLVFFISCIKTQKENQNNLSIETDTINSLQSINDTISFVDDINLNGRKIFGSVLDATFKSYSIVDYKVGDINKDGLKDIVAVIDSCVTDSINKDETCYRKFILLINAGKNKYDISILSNDRVNLIAKYNDSNANIDFNPSIEIIIKGTSFLINESIRQEFNTYSFIFDKRLKKWVLDKISRSTYDINDPEIDKTHEIKYKTKIETQKDFGFITFENR